jgi:hypothetical protein
MAILAFASVWMLSLITAICSKSTAQRWEASAGSIRSLASMITLIPSIGRDIDDDDRSCTGFPLFGDGHKGRWPNVVSSGGSVF